MDWNSFAGRYLGPIITTGVLVYLMASGKLDSTTGLAILLPLWGPAAAAAPGKAARIRAQKPGAKP